MKHALVMQSVCCCSNLSAIKGEGRHVKKKKKKESINQ